MAFRDDREALRHEIRELRRTVSSLGEERDTIRGRIDELNQEIAQSARLMSGFHIGCLVPFIILAAIVGLGLAFGDESSSRTVFGRVVGSDGATDIQTGDRCTAWLSSGGDDWDAQTTVMCAGKVLYDDGYMDCDAPDEYMKCADRRFTADDDDPAFEIDRTAGTLVLWDGNPQWSIHIALGRPDLE